MRVFYGRAFRGLLAMLALLGLCAPAVTASPTPPAALVDDTHGGFTRYTLQPGTGFHVVLQTPVNTAVSQVGDPIEAMVTNTVYLGQRVLLSRNTRFAGSISRLEPPVQGRDAVLKVSFSQIRLENGETLPMEAYIKTDLPDHSWGGGLTPGTKPKTVVHHVWGIGDYGKTVFVGPRRMGNHIEFLPGERWTMILEQPVTVVLPVEEAAE